MALLFLNNWWTLEYTSAIAASQETLYFLQHLRVKLFSRKSASKLSISVLLITVMWFVSNAKGKNNKGKIKWNELNWKTRNFLRKLNNLLFPVTHSQTFGNEELTLQNCKNCCATESDLHVAVCICLSRVNVIWYLNSHKQKSRFSL